MFRINDTVIYKGSGLCRIEDIRTEKLTNERREYFVLRPVCDAYTTYFIPVGSEDGKLIRLIDKGEIDALFEKVKKCGTVWVDDEKKRYEIFSDIINSADRVKTIKMIEDISRKRDEENRNGHKHKASDEDFLKRGQQMIESELSYVLSIEPEQVKAFILNKLHLDINMGQ